MEPRRRRSRRVTTPTASPRATPAQPPTPRVRITDFLRPDAVIDDLSGRTARAVLGELCRPHAGLVDLPRALEALLEREREGSTGFVGGLAIPHARINGLPRIVASFGRSKPGVEFKAVDGERSHFFFALLTPELRAPEQAAGRQVYANLLARISFLFERPGLRRAILTAPDSSHIYRLIAREDELHRRRRDVH